MAFSLSLAALDDMSHIYLEGVRVFGPAQADGYFDDLYGIYDLLAANPRMGRENNTVRPAIRFFPTGSHVVVYEITPAHDILVLRVRHHREDWKGDPVGDD